MLIRLTIALIAGVLVAWRLEISPLALALFALAAMISTVLLRSRDRPVWPALMVAALLLGALRYELGSSSQQDDLTAYHSVQGVLLEGAVVDDPQSSGTLTRLRLRTDRVFSQGEWEDATGDVLVTLRPPVEIVAQRERPYFRYGERLLLQGELKPPPDLEEFDYAAYLAKQGIRTVMSFPTASLQAEGGGSSFYRWLYGVRHDISSSLARSVPEPQASVGQSVLLGIRSGLPADLQDDFRATGTSHLLAISGLHVGVLLAMSLGVSQAIFGRRRHLYLATPLVLVWLYALMSGASPSAVRAAIMGTVYLAALLSGRPRSILPALAFAAAVMVAVDPSVLWRVSFQLSFAAMAGIGVFASPMARRLRGEYDGSSLLWVKAAIIEMTSMTLAAILTTLPLVAFYFKQVSLVGVPASLLTLPAMPFVLMSNAMAGIAGLINPVLGSLFGWVAWLFTSYVTSIVGLMARVPVASVEIADLGVPMVVAWYAVLVLIYGARNANLMTGSVIKADTFAKRMLPVNRVIPRIPMGIQTWLALPMLALGALLWVAALSGPSPRLHVYFVDVGQGDAVFIVTPNGSQVLVDGGPNTQIIAQFLGQGMPPGDRTIDMAVLTHPHADHVTGLAEVLRRYEVDTIIHRSVEYDSPSYQEWLRAVEAEDARTVEAQAGQVIAFGDGTALEVLSPPERLPEGTRSDVDNASVVLRLSYGNRSFLLAGDIFEESEWRLLAAGVSLDSDVLKVGHHGSRHSTTTEFLAEVSPAMAVISAGADNRYGHPHQEALARILADVAPDLVYETSKRGTMEMATDGDSIELNFEK